MSKFGETQKTQKRNETFPLSLLKSIASLNLPLSLVTLSLSSTHNHSCTHTNIHTYTLTHTHIYTHIYTYTHTHTHTQSRIHTYTHAHTHVHILLPCKILEKSWKKTDFLKDNLTNESLKSVSVLIIRRIFSPLRK